MCFQSRFRLFVPLPRKPPPTLPPPSEMLLSLLLLLRSLQDLSLPGFAARRLIDEFLPRPLRSVRHVFLNSSHHQI